MRSRIFLVTTCLMLFLAAVGLVKAADGKKEEASPAPKAADAKAADAKAADVKEAVDKAVAAQPAAPAKSGTPIALTVEALQEIEDRKTALDLREKQLNERARDLEMQEKLLKEKLKKMEELNRKMAERLDFFKKDHEERINKLVTIVSGMRPEMAARYVENLDPPLAVQILARIKEERASKILNLVDKKLSARLTELYTGYRDSIEPPAAPQTPAKEASPTTKPM